MEELKPLIIAGIGVVKRDLGRTRLPTIKRVLQSLFYFHRKENRQIHESSILVAKSLIEIYNAKNVPLQRTWLVEKKIRGLYQKWRLFKKNFNKSGKCYDRMRGKWFSSLERPFDVASKGGHMSSKRSFVRNGNIGILFFLIFRTTLVLCFNSQRWNN